jgi:hypothetical protein
MIPLNKQIDSVSQIIQATNETNCVEVSHLAKKLLKSMFNTDAQIIGGKACFTLGTAPSDTLSFDEHHNHMTSTKGPFNGHAWIRIKVGNMTVNVDFVAFTFKQKCDALSSIDGVPFTNFKNTFKNAFIFTKSNSRTRFMTKKPKRGDYFYEENHIDTEFVNSDEAFELV